MNLIFSKIKLHNFFSFSDTELNLNDMGFTLVEGRNHCKLDNAYSNGSGKSSIFNGICFALTGETAQGISSGIENIFTDPDDCWVELTFMADNNEFVLKRYKTPKPDLKVWINGEDHSGKGIRESSRLLSTYLPDLTSTLVNSIIILGQGLPSRFTNNKPSHRKEILENLTKSDFMIQSIKDKLEKRQEDLRASLRAKEDGLLATNSQLEVYQLQLSNLKKDLLAYEVFDSSEENIDNKINQVKETILSISSEIENNRSLSNSKDHYLEELNSQYSKLFLDSSVELEEKLENVKISIKDKNDEINNLKTEVKILENEIKKLDSIVDICPTCGQKIPNVNKPSTVEQKAERDRLSENLKLYNDELTKLQLEEKEITKSHNQERDSRLSDISKNISKLKNDIKMLSDQNLSKTRELGNLKDEVLHLTNLKENYTKLLSDINTTEEIILTLENKKVNISSETFEIKSHLDIVQQMLTLAKREFRGILLINIIDYINKRIKQYSQVVFDTTELNFSLDENELDISYCGKPYENLSGGEKQKIDVIIQLALRDILSKQLNIRSNLLVCDEIFDNMDLVGCNKIIDLISSLTDVDSVFIISHHAQDLELTKDNSLIVEKSEDGISKIKFV